MSRKRKQSPSVQCSESRDKKDFLKTPSCSKPALSRLSTFLFLRENRIKNVKAARTCTSSTIYKCGGKRKSESEYKPEGESEAKKGKTRRVDQKLLWELTQML